MANKFSELRDKMSAESRQRSSERAGQLSELDELLAKQERLGFWIGVLCLALAASAFVQFVAGLALALKKH